MVAATARPATIPAVTRTKGASALSDAHILTPRPPFSFGQALAFLKRFPPTQGDRVVAGDAVLGAARVDGRTVGFGIEEAGSVDAPALRCTLVASDLEGEPLDAATVDAVLTRIGDWLGIEDDLAPLYALLGFQALSAEIFR